MGEETMDEAVAVLKRLIVEDKHPSEQERLLLAAALIDFVVSWRSVPKSLDTIARTHEEALGLLQRGIIPASHRE